MLSLSLDGFLNAVKGKLLYCSNVDIIENVSIDTRTIKKGDLFIPLKGDKFDGHNFISAALEKGAIGFLTEYENDEFLNDLISKASNNLVVIKVLNALKSFQDLALYSRKRLKSRVVGITGSTGKTSTKDMLASICADNFKTVYSLGSFNNEIGAPLTILRAEEDTEVIILEMAMRGMNQIKELTEIALPDFGVITNVGKTHFEFLGSEEKIAEAKSELISSVSDDGIVVLNRDDKWFNRFKSLTHSRIITYGINNTSEVMAENIELIDGLPSFDFKYKKNCVRVNLSVYGLYNIYNALAAGAVALGMELDLKAIRDGLEKAVLSQMRMEILKMPESVTVLNDAYNASPDSMREALKALNEAAGKRRKIAVLGDMLELGSISHKSHLEVGGLVRNNEIDILVTVGEKAKSIAKGAMEKNGHYVEIHSFGNLQEAVEFLIKNIQSDDIILVKASRAMHFEYIINGLSQKLLH
ncbi:MAG: UDP-N-acetylmuramoyl-tripeptide--D-alanyl-D-alanine ligase [Actinobacteria bacterium]|nr:UDP-N-acetylmuramoyl-tripeptide--D-alanyl-D-alanine ligase [Actinomycetota bacterium]